MRSGRSSGLALTARGLPFTLLPQTLLLVTAVLTSRAVGEQEMRTRIDAATFRPPRLNFAQVCTWCLTPWCESAECAAKHEAAWWAPCPDCLGWMDDSSGCHCWNGVAQCSSEVQAQQLIRTFLQEADALLAGKANGAVVELRPGLGAVAA
jgi:hypothetical protein